MLIIKIYPSPHQLYSTEKPKFLDIPVAHIEKEYHPTRIIAERSADFVIPSEEYIAPYQRFKTDSNLFFDKDRNPVKVNLKLRNNRYVYEPESSQEFLPNTFSLNALVKRRDQYDSGMEYNINIGVYKQGSSTTFAKNLISLFGNAPYRGTAPANVKVNNCSTDAEALLHENDKDLDFLIVNTCNGVYSEDKKNQIDFSQFMNEHCNLWITVTDDGYSNFFSGEDENANYITQMLKFDDNSDRPDFNNQRPVIISKDYGYAALNNAEHPLFKRSSNNYVIPSMSVRSPIIVIEKPDTGYIVISHKNLFNSIENYGGYIYNVIIQLYLHSYIETDSIETWITDEPVDYIGSLNTPYRRNHPVININDMVLKKQDNISRYKIINERISRDDIFQESIDSYKNVYFKKLLKTDPVKQSAETVSIFTVQNTVVYYDNPRIRLIEDDVHIYTQIDDNENCYITVSPFISSSNRIIVNEPKKFKIDDIEQSYDIYVLPINKDNISEVVMVESYKNSQIKSAIYIGTVHVEFEGDPFAYDIRMLGGGLPQKYNNYEMLDIGNIKGRPYRTGTGAVIKLPKRFEKDDVKIRDAVARYKVAADKFYFVYQ